MDHLTDRENDVLALLCEGLRNRQIAEVLEIGTETVKSHLASIYKKLGVDGRGAAISVGLRDRYRTTSSVRR